MKLSLSALILTPWFPPNQESIEEFIIISIFLIFPFNSDHFHVVSLAERLTNIKEEQEENEYTCDTIVMLMDRF